jgi:anti-repressor protein
VGSMIALNVARFAGLTMSSQEIAATTGSSHDNVLKTIRRLVASGLISGNETLYRHPQNNQVYPEFLLAFRDTMVVVSGYSAELRARIIDRWLELEAKAAAVLPDFKNPAEAARAWAAQYEAREALEHKVAADAPKVAFAEAVRAIDGACHIEKIAKTLGHGRNKFFKRLRADGILLDNNLPYQKYIDREYFTVIEQQPYTDSKGVTHATFTTMVTGAGQVFLAKRYANIAGSANA